MIAIGLKNLPTRGCRKPSTLNVMGMLGIGVSRFGYQQEHRQDPARLAPDSVQGPERS